MAEAATTVRAATAALFRRYAALLEGVRDDPPPPDAKAGADNLRWMCRTALENVDAYPVDKLSRWLGFVQGVLTMRGLVTVDGERDFSRPLFHAAYRGEGTPVPPTREMGAADAADPGGERMWTPDRVARFGETMRDPIGRTAGRG